MFFGDAVRVGRMNDPAGPRGPSTRAGSRPDQVPSTVCSRAGRRDREHGCARPDVGNNDWSPGLSAPAPWWRPSALAIHRWRSLPRRHPTTPAPAGSAALGSGSGRGTVLRGYRVSVWRDPVETANEGRLHPKHYGQTPVERSLEEFDGAGRRCLVA